MTGATTIDNAVALSGGTASVNTTANATLSGNITGAGGLTKTGAAALTLALVGPGRASADYALFGRRDSRVSVLA